MADLASPPTDLATETVDAVAPDPITADPDDGDGNLLSELARAMHAAATSQSQRLNADLERRRAEQVEAITQRASSETENLKADSEAGIGAIDAWAKAETEKIKLERLRRIDARREQLSAELGREETIKEREIFAIEVAIDAHRNEMELFFGRLERETDPSSIARVAATMPQFPSLGDVASQARRSATAEFATIEGQVTTEPSPEVTGDTSATIEARADGDAIARSADVAEAIATEAEGTAIEAAAAEGSTADTSTDGDLLESAAAVSETRLKAVMDPAASRGGSEPGHPWEAPYAVSVAAGSGPAEAEPAQLSVGSTLLRTVRSIRPMAGRHDKDSGEGDTAP
jgi:hypothetical protein